MKIQKLAVAIAASTMLASCSTLNPSEDPTYRVGPQYVATGSVSGVTAYIYGGRTLLRYNSAPVTLSIRDAAGRKVGFEREGQYYRLDRQLSDFTVRANLVKSTNFHFRPVEQPAPAKPMPAPIASPAAPVPPVMVAPAPARPQPANTSEEAQLQALLSDAQRQLAQVKEVLANGTVDPETLDQLHSNLDAIQERINQFSGQVASTVLMVHFDRYKSGFEPSPEVANLLVSAASAAERVEVRGRTDSVIPGSLDGKIAHERAWSARTYLVNKGIAPEKIEVTSLAAGDFIAPNTPEGRRLNRRVEIELHTRNRPNQTAQLARLDNPRARP